MSARITPLEPDDSPDAQVNELLEQGRDGWWNEPQAGGVPNEREAMAVSLADRIAHA